MKTAGYSWRIARLGTLKKRASHFDSNRSGIPRLMETHPTHARAWPNGPVPCKRRSDTGRLVPSLHQATSRPARQIARGHRARARLLPHADRKRQRSATLIQPHIYAQNENSQILCAQVLAFLKICCKKGVPDIPPGETLLE